MTNSKKRARKSDSEINVTAVFAGIRRLTAAGWRRGREARRKSRRRRGREGGREGDGGQRDPVAF